MIRGAAAAGNQLRNLPILREYDLHWYQKWVEWSRAMPCSGNTTRQLPCMYCMWQSGGLADGVLQGVMGNCRLKGLTEESTHTLPICCKDLSVTNSGWGSGLIFEDKKINKRSHKLFVQVSKRNTQRSQSPERHNSLCLFSFVLLFCSVPPFHMAEGLYYRAGMSSDTGSSLRQTVKADLTNSQN